MRPTLALSKNGPRLPLTTKSVNGGYYKGNRVGSMGAHTSDGRYIIDYRKVRTYNCPDLTGFNLTPFVTAEMKPTRTLPTMDGMSYHLPAKIDGREMIQNFKMNNTEEWEKFLNMTENAGQGDSGSSSAEANSEHAERQQ